MDISSLFKRLRKVSMRKVGLYLTDLLTQLEGLQFTIKSSDLKDHMQPTISEQLGSTIEEIDRILFQIETNYENKDISEHKAEQLIADFQKMKRQTKKAYIDLGKDRSISDQDLSDLLKEVNCTLNQVPLRQSKRILKDVKEADNSLTKDPLSQREPAALSR